MASELDIEHRVVFSLYSPDGKRCTQVHERRDGRAFYIEQEWVEGTTFRARHPDYVVRLFDSTEAAELAAVATPWFRGEE